MAEGDVLDDGVWKQLAGIIDAAHRGDGEEFAERSLRASRELPLPGHQRAGAYVHYLLRYALGDAVGGRVPTDEELRVISEEVIVQFNLLVNAERARLEDLFRTVFDRPPLDKVITPGELLTFGSAALGVLYVDPGQKLSLMKPKLENWWRKNAERIYRMGIQR